MPSLVAELPDGPLDLIGDIHGEFGALERLLALLGYGADGTHPENRHLVFLGDLVDRGPDSVAVVRLVRQLVEQGAASCVLGNHELNLLLEKRREGNQWFWGERQKLRDGALLPQALATEQDQVQIREFLQGLPLMLQRRDLVAVHACWTPSLSAKLSLVPGRVDEVFREWESRIDAQLLKEHMELRSLYADLQRQNHNPITVATSGLERPTKTPFHAGGRLRNVERVPWWEAHDSERIVVFGHYWRAFQERERPVKAGPYLFAALRPQQALGPRGTAVCIDYSVGHRNVERAQGGAYGFDNALAALRMPERELVFDRAESLRLEPPEVAKN